MQGRVRLAWKQLNSNPNQFRGTGLCLDQRTNYWFRMFQVLPWDAAVFKMLEGGVILSEFLHLSFTRILFPVHTLTSLTCFPWIERQKHSAAPRTKQTCCACALGDAIIDYLSQPRTHFCSSRSSIPNFNRPMKRRKKTQSFRKSIQSVRPPKRFVLLNESFVNKSPWP